MPIVVNLATPSDGSLGLSLCDIWLNDTINPSDLCSFKYAGDELGFTQTSRAEVRQLINRRRVIRRGTRTYTSVAITMPWLTPTQLQWLREHEGRIVTVRDHVGTKIHAVYLDLSYEVDTSRRDRADTKITLEQVTFSEAVA